MFGKVNQAKLAPTLQGVMGQTSTYGATIPRIFGTTMTAPLITWMDGIRKADSGKKGSKKSSVPTYRACVDMLLGHNPIQHVLRVIASNVGLGLRNNKQTGVSGPSHTITDPDFYCVVGVTANVNYSFAVNDYGGQGPVTLTGTAELPCWNTAQQGPDPVNPSGYRWSPYTYYCLPGSAVITQLYGGFTYNVYYAGFVLTGWGAGQIPVVYVLNSTFESSLGDGTAYTDFQDFTAQRIIYPWFAGIGSFNFDIGMGAVPQIRTETLGAYSLYPDPPASLFPNGPSSIQPRADADYADMVEDVFKMGQTQAAMLATGVGVATGSSPIQAGVSCWEYPGTVQKKFWTHAIHGNFGGSMQYDVPVTKGDILVVAVAQPTSGASLGITDSLINAWTPVISTATAGYFYATANASGLCTINLNHFNTNADVQILGIGGMDTVDAALVFQQVGPATVPSGTVITSSIPGQAGYILTWVFPDLFGDTGSGTYQNWKPAIKSSGQGGNFYGAGPANSYSQFRRTFYPTAYTFTGDVATSTWTLVMLALKNSVAPSYPKALGDILDSASLDLCRTQCRANGLWGSLNMNSQKKAADWLSDLYLCMNAAFVWSGFKGKSVPLSEVSFANNGASYISPTAAGPVANITEQDYIGAPGSPMVTVTRRAVVDRPDLLRVQHPDANNNYNNTVVSQPDVGGLSLYGLRYTSPKVLDMVQHVEVARMLLGIMVRRQNYLVRTYKFKLQARWKLLEAMDLITVTDAQAGLTAVPVRLTSVQENEKYELDCEAEDFIYGLSAPKPLPVTQNQSSGSGSTVIPAAVNAPVFLEPPAALTGDAQDELWIAVSDADAAYGGCIAYVSVDAGASYTQLGIIHGSATTGFTVGDWPQALDPDTADDLAVDLTESAGQLAQYSVAQQDQFLYPCYVAGSGIFPFELMTYAVATLTSAFHYTLKATGGGTNKLRRAAFGTWVSLATPNTGSDHPNASRFAFLDPADIGLLKVTVPSAWFGKTLYFKFVQFNFSGSGFSSLSAATAYPYMIIGNGSSSSGGGGTGGSGGGGQSTYTINPTNPLTNPDSTHIDMAAVTATFSPSNAVTHYNARMFSISDPGATPQIYYVTVYDPNFVGDTGSGTNLTAYCQTTQAAAHVGQPGYIYMGSILAIHLGGGTSGGGGSNPPSGTTVRIVIPSTTRGDFSIAHGLGQPPSDVGIKIQSNGLIRFQSPTMWDATNVYLNASDDGLTGTLVIEL